MILTGGGMAAPKTGSDGSALDMAVQLGHVPAPFRPALVPLTLSEKGWKEADGVRVIASSGLCIDVQIARTERG